MKIEEQVVSLEREERLKELGMKQYSHFYWREGCHTEESFDNSVSLGKRGVFEGRYRIQAYPHPRMTTADIKWNDRDLARLNETEFSAFTSAELDVYLMKTDYTVVGQHDGFWVFKRHPDTTLSYGMLGGHGMGPMANRADRRASLLVKLIEEGTVTP